MKGAVGPESALGGIPDGLRTPLLDEFNKLARHYRESRWEPAELNGGKLCEIVYTILKGHVDSAFPPAPAKPGNMVDACKALESAHNFPRAIRIQIPRMLVALYEIRNNRNVGHVGADIDPNHMDATVVYGLARWVLSELVRIFHSISPEDATAVVDALTEREIPLLWRIGERTRVLGTQLSAKHKTLVLLYGSAGAVSARDIASSIDYKNVSQLRQKVLRPAHDEDLLDFDMKADTALLSPIGARFVEQNIPLKL